MVSNQLAMVSTLVVMASNLVASLLLVAMVSNQLAMASTLVVMASNLVASLL